MTRHIASTLVAREFTKIVKPKRLTPLQFQKLVFLAHGWSFPKLKKPLVSDRVEAWDYGPVFPELYFELKHYGATGVKDVPIGPQERLYNRTKKVVLHKCEKKVIRFVNKKYGHLTGPQLIELTHNSGGPWRETPKGNIIKSSVIEAFFIEQHKMLKEIESNGDE